MGLNLSWGCLPPCKTAEIAAHHGDTRIACLRVCAETVRPGDEPSLARVENRRGHHTLYKIAHARHRDANEW
ncbi:MAG TPA: hypothetical protein VFZ04_20995 [Longimicrobiales bacterium]